MEHVNGQEENMTLLEKPNELLREVEKSKTVIIVSEQT